ncbi:enoyl-CoA hydratase/isomerase family protein [Paracandidimonas soli]|uniref:enoyl-CoA hydratase/isomerase family protein n=1 Tax=Paracandidimonas soli TaxID=1917182 RepID=UPI003340B135
MIKIDIRDRVGTITLDRLARRNAMGSEMVARFSAALEDLDRNPDVGAMVLTGDGNTFCAGSDLKELGSMDPAGMAEHERITAAAVRRMPNLDKPIIAAVEGYAMGGGFILACACDIVVAAGTSKWLLAEVPNGWLPPWGLQPLAAKVGPVVAKRLTLGHEMQTGADLHRIGLVDYLAEDGQSQALATDHARRIAALPPAAVRSTKRFFAPMIAGLAEPLDAAASDAFLENCTHAPALATLAKFGVRHD